MTTKARTELTLFDMLSRLTFACAARLLGPDSSRLIAAGGKHDIDIGAQVEFDKERFRLAIDSTTVTLTLNSAALATASNGAVVPATRRASMSAPPSP